MPTLHNIIVTIFEYFHFVTLTFTICPTSIMPFIFWSQLGPSFNINFFSLRSSVNFFYSLCFAPIKKGVLRRSKAEKCEKFATPSLFESPNSTFQEIYRISTMKNFYISYELEENFARVKKRVLSSVRVIKKCHK